MVLPRSYVARRHERVVVMPDKQMSPGGKPMDQGKMPSKDMPADKGGGKMPENKGMPGKK